MAFVADQDEEQQQQAGQPQQAGPVLGAPAAAPAQGGGQAPAASSGKPKQSRSGSFMNLNNYLQANQGNDAQMGQAVRGAVDNQAGNATRALGGMQQEATQQIDRGTVRQDATVQDAIKTSPTQFKNNEDLTNKFQQQYNASYAGPQSATDVRSYGDTRQAFEKVRGLVGASQGGYQGAQNLVGQTFRNPSYTQGQRSLDSFILGGGKQGQQALQGIKKDYGDFDGNFSNAENQINAAAQTARATTDATKKAVRDAVTAKDQEFAGYFDQVEKTAGDKTKAQQDLYQKAVGGDVASLKQLTGLDEATINSLKSQNYEFSNMAKAGSAYGLGDLADKSKVENYQSLMSLIGKSPARNFDPAGGKDASFDTTQAEVAKQLPGLTNEIQSALSGAKTGQLGSLLTASDGRPIMPAMKRQMEKDLASIGLTWDDWTWARNNGVDPRKLIAEKQLTAGDVAGGQLTAYDNIAKTLGLTPGFQAGQGLGVQRSANQQLVEALRDANALDDDLTGKLTKAQKARKAEADAAYKDAWTKARKSGALSWLPEDEAKSLFDQHFKRGRELSHFDVSDAKQRGQWAGLSKALGVNGLDFTDRGVADPSYSFDEAGLRAALTNKFSGETEKQKEPNRTEISSTEKAPAPPPPAAKPDEATPYPWEVGVDPGPLKDSLLQPMSTGGGMSAPRFSDKNTKDDIKDIAWSNIRKMVK